MDKRAARLEGPGLWIGTVEHITSLQQFEYNSCIVVVKVNVTYSPIWSHGY
jgi:hypothetical protein